LKTRDCFQNINIGKPQFVGFQKPQIRRYIFSTTDTSMALTQPTLARLNAYGIPSSTLSSEENAILFLSFINKDLVHRCTKVQGFQVQSSLFRWWLAWSSGAYHPLQPGEPFNCSWSNCTGFSASLKGYCSVYLRWRVLSPTKNCSRGYGYCKNRCHCSNCHCQKQHARTQVPFPRSTWLCQSAILLNSFLLTWTSYVMPWQLDSDHKLMVENIFGSK